MVKQDSAIKNFWMVFFATVAVLAVVCAAVIATTADKRVSQMRMSVVDDENYYKTDDENNYKRALYATCDSLKNLDANLGKAALSRSAENQAQQLTNAVIHANQVNQNLASLPIAEGDNLSACQKFVNQTQDYATYLLKKLARGEGLSPRDRVALGNLDNVATEMYNFLQEYAQSDSGLFLTNGNGKFDGALSESLQSVQENAFAYEKLIYDGPFSDSVVEKSLKCGKKVTAQQGEAIVKQLFGSASFLYSVNRKGLWYCYSLENGRVMLSCDGRVAQFERYTEEATEGQPVSKEVCIAKAEEFCKKLGYDVKGVWVSKTQDQTTYVNCATVVDGVIVYPDLIKVAVDSFSGEVVGCEAKAYLFNHKDWQVNFGEVTQQQAQQQVDPSLTVTNVAKALVEKNHRHYLCYEFQCEGGGRQYYVYVDSFSGQEVEIFKVIQNTEGHTLM